MSPKARRLTASVETQSLPWQRVTPSDRPASATVVPLFPRAERPAAAIEDITLPSLSAERLATAESAAYAHGHAEGYHAGQKATMAQATAMVRSLSSALKELSSLRTEMMRRSEHDLVRLAIALAEGIVLREVDFDRSLLISMAEAAIARLGEKTTATIRLNPDDYQAALRAGVVVKDEGTSVMPDPAVAAGGCLVGTPFGEIDAGIDTQMRELARALVGTDDISELPAAAAPPYGLAAGA
jgi:flagellar biosynthesis/type III secretory pathway protein FliH